MKVIVYVDIRERELYAAMLKPEALPMECRKEITIQTIPLPLGDVWISLETAETREVSAGESEDDPVIAGVHIPCAVVERKTWSDFESSLLDGRNQEQTFRLRWSGTIAADRVFYFLEGEERIYSMERKRALVTSQFLATEEYGFRVITPRNVADSALYALGLAKLFADEKLEPSPTPHPAVVEKLDYSHVVKVTKVGNRTPEVKQVLMLCQCEQVGEVVAKGLLRRFGSLENIISVLKTKGPSAFNNILLAGNTFSAPRRSSNKLGEELAKVLLMPPITTFIPEEPPPAKRRKKEVVFNT